MADNLTFNVGADTSNAVSNINAFFDIFETRVKGIDKDLNTALGGSVTKEVTIRLQNGKAVAGELQTIDKTARDIVDVNKALNGEYGNTIKVLKNQKNLLNELRERTRKYKSDGQTLSQNWIEVNKAIKGVNTALQEAQRNTSAATQRAEEFKSRITAINAEIAKSRNVDLGGEKFDRATNGANQLSQALRRTFLGFVSVQTVANLFTGAIQGMARAVNEFVGTAFQLELLDLQLKAFTGSAAEGERAFGQFLETAARTPFDLQQVASAGRIMLAFGASTEEAIYRTDQLGIIASATGGDLNNLARNLGQVNSQGRAYTRDLTQFAIQGIPIWDTLAITMGKSTTELKDMAAQGLITGKEVGDALDYMTAEGSAFAEIAEEMKDTWIGRLNNIKTQLMELGRSLVDVLNTVEEGLGGSISGAMENLANLIAHAAKTSKTWVPIVLGLTAAWVGFWAVNAIQGWYAAVKATQLFVAVTKAQTLAAKAAAVAQAVLNALTGNWVGLAAGIAAGAAVYGTLSYAINQAGQETAEAAGDTRALADELANFPTDGLTILEKEQIDNLKDAYGEARKLADERRKDLDVQVDMLKEMKKQVKERYDLEKEKINERKEVIKQAMDEEKERYDQQKETVKTYYDQQIDKAKELQSIRDQQFNDEIAKLRERTPAEEKLYNLEKKKLQEKARNGSLDEEERLRAQARLERMERTEQIEKRTAERKKEQKAENEKIKQLEEAREKKLESIKDKHEKITGKLKDQYKLQEEKLKVIEGEYKKQIQEIDNAVNSSKKLTESVEITSSAVQTQIGKVQTLTREWRNAEIAANNYAKALTKVAGAKNKNLSGKGTEAFNNFVSGTETFNRAMRFAGGPVDGGSSYTVNELGQEAFLSAAGKLSMINAPSFGKWRAPGAGTVIPAHLTKQLDIPSGGVQVNGGANAVTNRAAAGSAGLVRALRGVSGGSSDRITNNVTIQAANTTQAASDMMVQLNKIRRRRYS